MKEANLLTGPLEPTNLYGPGDNYHPDNSHVIPALIRKFHEAKLANAPTVTVWGSDTPRREFMYSEDMADACVHVMNLPDDQYASLLGSDETQSGKFEPPLINIGVGLLNRAGWTASTGFEQGLGVAYAEFVATNAF